MMQFTFESPKQFKRITTRLQRVFSKPRYLASLEF